MSMTVTIEGIDELLARLNRGVVRAKMLEAMEKATSLVHYEIAKYPPRVRTPQDWKSDAQRRWFFANLKAGTIEVPYVRKGLLGRSWSTRQWAAGDNIIGEVSNAVPYGPYVQGEWQTGMHASSGWQTLPAAADKQMDKIKNIFSEALERAIDEMAGGE